MCLIALTHPDSVDILVWFPGVVFIVLQEVRMVFFENVQDSTSRILSFGEELPLPNAYYDFLCDRKQVEGKTL
jgi:hypothetical protein